MEARLGANQRFVDQPLVVIAAFHPENNALILLQHSVIDVTQVNSMQFIASVLDKGLQRWQDFSLQARLDEQEQSASRCGFISFGESTRKRKTLTSMEEERTEKKETKEKLEIELKSKKRIKKAKLELKPEPVSKKYNLVKLRINFPNGQTIERLFDCCDQVQQIFCFVESHELRNTNGNIIEEWELIRTFPNAQKYTDPNLTLKEAGITQPIKLFVQESLHSLLFIVSIIFSLEQKRALIKPFFKTASLRFYHFRKSNFLFILKRQNIAIILCLLAIIFFPVERFIQTYKMLRRFETHFTMKCRTTKKKNYKAMSFFSFSFSSSEQN
ncbi:hypothetical protein RFI_23285 [Reticulomyxa filosa]|uniref:UBX domain-containing protein n=1 Tax=Reticulomyxa filosa TaxID=46433 RepID=X6MJ90_RETFI|nr:hypothetical protein RFI_23285 [Reticulomyxa filosa]|eukprot:ETO14083.1 hypothetical protein RFI_23285 [Reticulomyxa filosa]